MKKTTLPALVFLFISSLCLAAEKPPSYMTYGEGWAYFAVKMAGWDYYLGNEQIAGYYALKGYEFNNSPAIIYFRIIQKDGRTLKAILQEDIDGFKAGNRDLRLEDLELKSRYGICSKIFHYSGKTDYISIIDPGARFDYCVIACMNSGSKYAARYKNAFAAAVRGCGTFMITQIDEEAEKSGISEIPASAREKMDETKAKDKTGKDDIMLIKH